MIIAVHDFRNKKLKRRSTNVSRSTALFALGEVNDDIQYSIEQYGGANWEDFKSILGLEGFKKPKSSERGIVDFELSPYLGDTAEQFKSRFPSFHEFGSIELAIWILYTVDSFPEDGRLPKLLNECTRGESNVEEEKEEEHEDYEYYEE